MAVAAAVAFLLIVSLVSLLMSVCLFSAIIHGRFCNRRQHIFVLVSATFDMLRGAVVFGMSVMYFTPAKSDGSWCTVIIFMHTWFSCGCLHAVFSVLYDRLAYVTGPVTYKDRVTLPVAATLTVYSILNPLFCAVLPPLGWGSSTEYNGTTPLCSVAWGDRHGYGYFLLVWGYGIPLMAVCIVYSKLGLVANKRIKYVTAYMKPELKLWPMGMRTAIPGGRLTELDASYMKIWQSLSVVFLACLSSWAIYIFNGIFLATKQTDVIDSDVSASVAMLILTFLTNIVNSLVFGVFNIRYRNAFRSLVACGKQTESDVTDISRLHVRSVRDISLEVDNENSYRDPHEPMAPPIGIPKTVWTDKTSAYTYSDC